MVTEEVKVTEDRGLYDARVRHAVGNEDARVFPRAFQAPHGRTPSAYRKKFGV
jgi:hypothetical protein